MPEARAPFEVSASPRARARARSLSPLAVLAAPLAVLAAFAACVDIPTVVPETSDAEAPPADANADDARGGATPDATPDAEPGVDAASAAPDASDADAGPPCLDKMTDPLNCGRCGRSCLGARCTAGVCETITLLPSQGHPWSIAVDDTSIYWTDRAGSQVLKAPKSQPTGAVSLASGATGGATLPTAIAIDADAVYWINDASSAVRRCAKAGCSGASTLVAAADRPGGLAVDATRVYFTERSSGEIRAVDKLASNGTPVTLATSPGYAQQIAVDDTTVFWTDDYNAPTARRVSRAPKTGLAVGESPLDVVTGQSSPFGIALTEGHVYWTNNSQPGAVRRAPKSGVPDASAPDEIGGGSSNPLNLVLTRTHAYWINQGDDVFFTEDGVLYVKHPYGVVMACDLPTCAGGARVLATQQDEAWGIAADDTAIYWTVRGPAGGGPGAIMKLAQQ